MRPVGGVDSSVAAELVHRAIGGQLTCIFVNNGVLRKNEFVNVQKNLREKLGLNIDAVDASERFLSKLAGVSEPEKKRKIIGNEFIAVFEEEAHRIEQLHGKPKRDARDAPHRAPVPNPSGILRPELRRRPVR